MDDTDKKQHPIAKRLEELIREKLSERKEEVGYSDETLGTRTFKPLGWKDSQKKANNLLRGQTSMSVSDFYILCEGLDWPPDRLFTICLNQG